MASNTPIWRYPLDLTGTNPNNKVVNEKHPVKKGKALNAFQLSNGAFFVDSLVVRSTPRTALVRNLDYRIIRIEEDAVKLTGKDVAMMIVLLPRVETYSITDVYVDYQVVGAQFSDTSRIAHDLINNHYNDFRGIYYSNIIDLPKSFLPHRHLHHIDDIYGLGFLREPMTRLVDIAERRLPNEDKRTWIKIHHLENRVTVLEAFDTNRVTELERRTDTLEELVGGKPVAHQEDLERHVAEFEHFLENDYGSFVNDTRREIAQHSDQFNLIQTWRDNYFPDLENRLMRMQGKIDESSRRELAYHNEVRDQYLELTLDGKHGWVLNIYKSREIELIQQRHSALYQRVENISSTLDLLGQQVVANENTLNNLSNTVRQIYVRGGETINRVNQLEQKVAEVTNTLGDHTHDISELRSNLSDLVAANEQQTQDFREDIRLLDENIQKKIDEIVSGVNEKDRDLSDRIQLNHENIQRVETKLHEQNNELTSHIENNRHELSGRINSLADEVDQYVRETKDNILTELGHEIGGVKDRIGIVSEDLDVLRVRQQEDYDRIQSDLESLDNTIGDTINELTRTVETNKRDSEARDNSLTRELDRQIARIDELTSQSATSTEDLEHRIEAEKVRNDAQDTKIAELVQSQQAQDREITGIKETQGTLREQIERKLNEAETNISKLVQDNIDAVSENINTLDERISSQVEITTNELNSLKEQTLELSGTVDENKRYSDERIQANADAIGRLKNTVEADKESTGDRLDTIERGITTINQTIEGLQEGATEDLERITRRIADAEAATTGNADKIERLKTDVPELVNAEVAKVKEIFTKVEENLSLAIGEITNKLDTNVDKVDRHIEKQKLHNQQNDADITKLKEDSQKLTERADFLKDKLDEEVQRIDGLLEELDSGYSDEIANLKDTDNQQYVLIDRNAKDIITIRDEKRALDNRVDELERTHALKHDEQEEKIDSLTEELVAFKETLTTDSLNPLTARVGNLESTTSGLSATTGVLSSDIDKVKNHLDNVRKITINHTSVISERCIYHPTGINKVELQLDKPISLINFNSNDILRKVDASSLGSVDLILYYYGAAISEERDRAIERFVTNSYVINQFRAHLTSILNNHPINDDLVVVIVRSSGVYDYRIHVGAYNHISFLAGDVGGYHKMIGGLTGQPSLPFYTNSKYSASSRNLIKNSELTLETDARNIKHFRVSMSTQAVNNLLEDRTYRSTGRNRIVGIEGVGVKVDELFRDVEFITEDAIFNDLQSTKFQISMSVSAPDIIEDMGLWVGDSFIQADIVRPTYTGKKGYRVYGTVTIDDPSIDLNNLRAYFVAKPSEVADVSWIGQLTVTYPRDDIRYIPSDKVFNIEPYKAEIDSMVQQEVNRYIAQQTAKEESPWDLSKYRKQVGAEDFSTVEVDENNNLKVSGVIIEDIGSSSASVVFSPVTTIRVTKSQSMTIPSTLQGRKALVTVRAESHDNNGQIIHSATRQAFITLPSSAVTLTVGAITSFGSYLTVNNQQEYPDAIAPRSIGVTKQSGVITIQA